MRWEVVERGRRVIEDEEMGGVVEAGKERGGGWNGEEIRMDIFYNFIVTLIW